MCQRFVVKGKGGHRGPEEESSWQAGFGWICTLSLYVSVIFKAIQHCSASLMLRDHCFILHRGVDLRIGEKTDYRKFHPIFTRYRRKNPNGIVKKFLKNFTKTFLLFQSKQHGK